ncbi:hypothetical protein GCM10027405_11050 [Arthrobacter alkaliphilus]
MQVKNQRCQLDTWTEGAQICKNWQTVTAARRQQLGWHPDPATSIRKQHTGILVRGARTHRQFDTNNRLRIGIRNGYDAIERVNFTLILTPVRRGVPEYLQSVF